MNSQSHEQTGRWFSSVARADQLLYSNRNVNRATFKVPLQPRCSDLCAISSRPSSYTASEVKSLPLRVTRSNLIIGIPARTGCPAALPLVYVWKHGDGGGEKARRRMHLHSEPDRHGAHKIPPSLKRR